MILSRIKVIAALGACLVFFTTCGLPDFTLVLTSPTYIKDNGRENLYLITGTVPSDSANILSYGVEFYYKIYAVDSKATAESQYASDTSLIRNATSSGVTNSVSVPSGFRKALRNSESSSVLNTGARPDLTPVIPMELSGGTSWELQLEPDTIEVNGVIVSSDSFSGSQKVALLRNLGSGTIEDKKNIFLNGNIVPGTDTDVAGTGTEFYMGIVIATYALRVSDFTNVYSRLVVPDLSGIIDISQALEE